MISVGFAVVTSLLLFTLNPLNSSDYAWKTRKVYPNNTDCIVFNKNVGTVCVSTFLFSYGATQYAAITLPYVDVRAVIITPHQSVYLSYNYTGPDWILSIGAQ